MREGKHAKKNFKIIEVYSVLILIATLFMGIGYAQITGDILTIEGIAETKVQDGVFIKDIQNVSSDLNTQISNSTIDYYIGTTFKSSVILGNNASSYITYQVSLQNNTDKEQLFIETLTDKTDINQYSNTNIEFTLNGVEEYKTTIAPRGELNFTITFKYASGADITKNTLISLLNFRFLEKPTLILSNEYEEYTLNNIYPDYTPKEYEFTVSNYEGEEINSVPMKYSFETTIDKPLTAKIYNEAGNEVTGDITIDASTKIDHKYTLKIIWDNSNEEENIDYDSIEYINKEFYCNVALKAIPNNDKYLDLVLTKEFCTNITSSDYRETFDISYVNITNNNYPAEIKEGEDLQITFIDSIPVELQVIGCESYTYNRPTLQINNVIADLEIKNPTGDIMVFEQKEAYTFNGNNILNTGIQLFDQENIDKDFEISFDIVSYGNTQEEYSTLVNSLYENSPYAGILLRIRDNRYEIVAQLTPDNIHYAELSEIIKFTYIRRNGIIYYKINNGNEVEIQSFEGFTDYFNVPVTFGGSLDGNGNPYRYFNGTLANMQIILLEEDKEKEDIIFQYDGEYAFNGNNILNTGIQLFDQENIDKDFEISFDIVSYGNTQEEYSTLVNSLYETSPYAGILLRIRENRYEIVAQLTPDNIHYAELSEITKFTYIRRNGIIYYKINNGNEVEIQSFEGFTDYFNVPVTFGGSLDENGNPYRYFNGILANMYVRVSVK